MIEGLCLSTHRVYDIHQLLLGIVPAAINPYSKSNAADDAYSAGVEHGGVHRKL